MHTPVGDVGSEVVLCQAFRSERPSGGGLETETGAPVGEVGWSRKVGAIPPRPDLPVGDWIALLAYHSNTWAGPRVARLSAWAEPLLGSQPPRDPGFMNMTHNISRDVTYRQAGGRSVDATLLVEELIEIYSTPTPKGWRDAEKGNCIGWLFVSLQ